MTGQIDPNPLNYPFRSMTDFSDERYLPDTGDRLEPQPVGLGPTADVAVADGLVYALTADGLTILDPGSLEVLGRLDGLLSTRQISVESAIAVVTAREAGCYVIDIADPAQPKLASSYDPLEFATGVHMARPDLAVLTNRHYGLEFVDVADPSAPRFVSSILVGEAQSVFCVGHIAYAGIWHERELVLVDFGNPARPVIVGRVPLDGFGDGVYVAGHHAYVATGHHSAQQRDPRTFELATHVTMDMLEQGYGRGHGVEVFDVSDPVHPRLVKRVKSPPGFCSPDTWRVAAAGNRLVQADSGSGVFVYDLTDPGTPRPLAHAVLPHYERHREHRTVSIQDDRHPVTGVAIAGDRLLIAGRTSDLYHCQLPTLSGKRARPVSPYPANYPKPDALQPVDAVPVLESRGQVHSVAGDGSAIIVAAGDDGIYLLEQDGFNVLAHQPTRGVAQHVFCANGLIYVSEAVGGLTIWERRGAALRQVGAWNSGKAVRQTLVGEDRPFGLVIVGAGEFAVLSLDNPAAPNCIASNAGNGALWWSEARPEATTTYGLIGHAYCRVMPDRLVASRYAIGVTQGSGPSWFDLSDFAAATCAPTSANSRLCPITEGVAVHGDRALVVQAGGYYFASPDRLQSNLETEHIREPNRFFSGVPHSVGADRLVITNRATGSARILDVTDVRAPKTIAYLHLPGHPDRPILIGDRLVFPCGRAGLREVRCP